MVKKKKKETNAFYFCVVVFLLPPSYYFKGFCCLSYIIWSTWLVSAVKQDFMSFSWQGKDNCGKSVCVEWYCSDLVGQIPMIVVLFKGKGCPSAHNHMLSFGRHSTMQLTKQIRICCTFCFEHQIIPGITANKRAF